jgi:hypothetical protein
MRKLSRPTQQSACNRHAEQILTSVLLAMRFSQRTHFLSGVFKRAMCFTTRNNSYEGI